MTEGGGRRRRLVRDYYLISVLLIGGGLITSGLVELFFRYFENRDQIALFQREVASGAAFKIEQFVHEIERTMKGITKSREIVTKGISPEFQFELRKLLLISPPVTDALALDESGFGRVEVSRLRTVPPGQRRDLSASPAFRQAKQGKSYFGPVYFVRGSEPYMTIAMPIERFAGEVIGVLQAEVNLKYIWDVISGVRLGKAGYAYAVTRSGDLVAHPDISLVLQRRSLAGIPQAREAFAEGGPGGAGPRGAKGVNLQGASVFSSSARIPGLDWAVIVEQPVEEAYERLYASLLRTSGLLLLGLGTALLASVFVARRVVRPLGRLREGVEKIGAGDFGYRIELKTGDEIEALAEEFNKMGAALQEALSDKVRREVEEAERVNRMKRYLSPQIAEAVLKSGGEDPFRVRRREVTVIFLDLRGFTNFSDSTEPEEVFEFLRGYHGEMGRLIFKYEGTTERFAGDGIMVFFNDPIPQEDHTDRAVQMALEMQARVRELRPGWLRRGYDLDLGVGLAAGYATLGTVGFEGRMDYAAIGNVTNLAARLSSEAKGGQILTNQRTLGRVEDRAEAEPVGELQLKGLTRPVPTFNIVRWKAAQKVV
ncbi:MAG: HAMP domain-containing protein [Candidatus Tectomicrobia bacterium]|uniref:HAMP domain-containing protein n=1 Tax=Tectimicrobiota bacterium TaxID=2528274 RepID=A0A932MNT7_UNCTE|nr:HAMP domain-containing protein [Candidatus Tectomicrobia bacterium]